jgi:hypothetical protein
MDIPREEKLREGPRNTQSTVSSRKSEEGQARVEVKAGRAEGLGTGPVTRTVAKVRAGPRERGHPPSARLLRP